MDERAHPILATVAFLISLVFGVSGGEGVMEGAGADQPIAIVKISVDPDPMKAGQSADVCYKFAGEGDAPVILKITWTIIGAGDVVDTVTISPSEPCVTVHVPASAGGVNIHDTSGSAPDYSGIVF